MVQDALTMNKLWIMIDYFSFLRMFLSSILSTDVSNHVLILQS